MRIVILAPGVYSETACAMAVQMARLGEVPVGALAISTLNRRTLLRKLGQLGATEFGRYARTKLFERRNTGAPPANPYLEPWLKHEGRIFHSLRDVAAFYGFPVATCDDQNSPQSIARLKQWSPDLIIFTGGNILRKDLLQVPRLGVLNVHLGLLPEVRGMNSPEWSLLRNIAVGISVHYMDAGIDTGPILQRCEFRDACRCGSLAELRNRLVAFGVTKVGEIVEALARGEITPAPQSEINRDNQFFVLHEWLRARAEARLATGRQMTPAGGVHG